MFYVNEFNGATPVVNVNNIKYFFYFQCKNEWKIKFGCFRLVKLKGTFGSTANTTQYSPSELITGTHINLLPVAAAILNEFNRIIQHYSVAEVEEHVYVYNMSNNMCKNPKLKPQWIKWINFFVVLVAYNEAVTLEAKLLSMELNNKVPIFVCKNSQSSF